MLHKNRIECVISFAITSTVGVRESSIFISNLAIASQTKLCCCDEVSGWHDGISNWMNELVNGWMNVSQYVWGGAEINQI